MLSSFRIGRIAGVDVRVHWTFVLLLLVQLATARVSTSVAALFLALLCAAVLLHELGHSLAARAFGIRVLDIVFWPLGGMARLERMPENARVEGLVALAGPAVNLVLVGASAAVLSALGGFATATPATGALANARAAVLAFFWINAVMAGFNLLPAFPLDGGRALRALFARRRDWLGATELAVRCSRWIALGGFLVCALRAPHYLCPVSVLCAYVLFESTRELFSVRLRHAQRTGLGIFGFPPFGGGSAVRGNARQGAERAPDYEVSPGAAPDAGEARATSAVVDASSEADEPPPAGTAHRPRRWSLGDWREGGADALEQYRGPWRPPPE
jgi:Zn-dependent protease